LNYLFRHANNYRVYGILKKIFSLEFFQKWNDIEKPKKKSEKRELAKVQVVQPNGTSGSSWHKWVKWNR